MRTSISRADGHNAQERVKWKPDPGDYFYRVGVKVVFIMSNATVTKVFREESLAGLTRQLKVISVIAGIQSKNIYAQDLAGSRMSHPDRARNRVHTGAGRPFL
jgi:hypothetical protein